MSKKPDMKTGTPAEWREWWSTERRRISLRTLRKIRKEAEERAAQRAAREEVANADCCRCLDRFGSEKRGGIEHGGHNLCSSCFFEMAIAKHEF